MTLFPNPGSGGFTVINPFSPEESVLTVNNLQGETVLSRTGEFSPQIEARLDFPGIYFVTLTSRGRVLHGKLTVVK